LDCGSCQPRWPTRCGALAAVVLLAVTVLSVGCGDVLFVPSPYTPQKIELVYSSQEDITIVRWRISSTAPLGDDLQFQILGENDGNPIDFSQSLFPGGGSTCADADGGTCFQYVVPGLYPIAQFPRPVIGLHATYGTLPGEQATARTEDQTLSASPFFQLTNDQVHVALTDTVAFEPPYVYARPYDRTMWPTKGLCVGDSVPAGVSFSTLAPPTYVFPADQPLSDSGIYCVGIRPTPSGTPAPDNTGCLISGYCPQVAEGRLATLPQVVDMHQTFTPPVEQSPIIYQIVFDLQIQVAERCDAALKKIEGLVDEYMQMPQLQMPQLPVKKLMTINIAKNSDATGSAPNCSQFGDGREALPDPTGMAAAVLQAVSSFPQTYQQFHFFYFNDQNFALPQPLTDSLEVFFNGLTAPPPYTLRTDSWLFNPGLAMASGPSWWMSTPWISPDDMTLEMTLASYVSQNLPYTSQIFDQNVPVPLLSPADAATYDGGFFKICDASPQVQPVDLSSGQLLYGQSWAIKASDPPGYYVALLPEIEKPGPSFTAESASVNFEICTAYCDHPFVSTNGTGATSWATSPLCSETQ
jgi:hypothetical protein